MSTTEQMPIHGTERNEHIETYADPGMVLAQPDGSPIAVCSSLTVTVSERYCGYCQAWIRCGNIVQHLLCSYCKAGWDQPPSFPTS